MLRIFLAFVISLLVFVILYRLLLGEGDTQTKVSERLKFGGDESESPEEAERRRREQVVQRRRPVKKLEDMTFLERAILPLKKSLLDFAIQFAPSSIKNAIEHYLQLAGQPARAGAVGSFLIRMVIFGIVVGVVTAWALYGSDMPAVRKISITILGTVIGAAIPIFALNKKISQRQDEIRRQLPEVLDLLTVSVEAGLSFDAALRRIVSRMHGPFIDECKTMLDSTKMGITKREALMAMSNRCGVQDVALFVTSVVQAEKLGSNMSGILQAQADNVRDRHRQFIRAQALKAPVKIVIPLVMFILPAIFIVALAPPLFTVAKNLFK